MKNEDTNTHAYFPSSSAIYEQAWVLYKKKLPLLIGINFVPVVFGIFYVLIIQNPHTTSDSSGSAILILLIGLASAFISLVSGAALLYGIIGENTVSQAYQKGWAIIWPLLWVSILSVLRVVAGLLLLVIPGVYMLVQYFFVQFVLIIEGKKGMAALSTSAAYVKGKWWKLFRIYSIVLLGYYGINYLLSLIPALFPESSLIIGELYSLVASPILTITLYILYTHCTSAKA
jgi:hypothetical protein